MLPGFSVTRSMWLPPSILYCRVSPGGVVDARCTQHPRIGCVYCLYRVGSIKIGQNYSQILRLTLVTIIDRERILSPAHVVSQNPHRSSTITGTDLRSGSETMTWRLRSAHHLIPSIVYPRDNRPSPPPFSTCRIDPHFICVTLFPAKNTSVCQRHFHDHRWFLSLRA